MFATCTKIPFWASSGVADSSLGLYAGGRGEAGSFIVTEDGAELIWFACFEAFGVMNEFVDGPGRGGYYPKCGNRVMKKEHVI